MGFFSVVKKIFGNKDNQKLPAAGSANDEKDAAKTGEKHYDDNGRVQNNLSGIVIDGTEADISRQKEPDAHSSANFSLAGKNEDLSPDGFLRADDADNGSLLVQLRAAPPRLSSWLDIVLKGIDGPGELLWSRLKFLLLSLEAPEQEINSFLENFKAWLRQMEYGHLDEFRSELQYQLAIALDLEDEEDERSKLILKLSDGLVKTRDKLVRQLDSLFGSKGELDDTFWCELEELLIMADMGYQGGLELVTRIRERARKNNVITRSRIKSVLLEELEDIFYMPRKINAINLPEVVLMAGVNGAGKTTTIAKLAYRAKLQGKKVLMVAGDTFRAAAVEQLEVWAERIGVDFFSKAQGTEPAAVAYESIEKGIREKYDIIFIDTAGRLQTKTNLMDELKKIRQVLAKKHPGSPHRCVLVLDATTGQNALSQAKLFREAANADELILTKLDGTAKGGVAIAVAMQEHLPISYVGLGEKMEDLRPFNGEDYIRALLGEEKNAA